MVDEIFAGQDITIGRQAQNMAYGAFARLVGERAENITVRNGIISSQIKKERIPQIEQVKKRMGNRQTQIDSDKTSPENKKQFLIDQKRDNKLLKKLESKLEKTLKPYTIVNQLQNAVITQVADNLNYCVPGSNFRDMVALTDKWVSTYTGDIDTGSATAFAPPTTGFVPGMIGGPSR